MFEKFEEDPYDVELNGIMTNEEYTAAIAAINKRIRKARPGKVDGALLATAPLLLFPLAIWGVRHSRQMKKRKRFLNQGIDEFNAANPTLLMRWNRKPKSILTIERREGQHPTEMTQAQFVGDMMVQAMPQPQVAPAYMTPAPTQAQIPPAQSAPNGPQYMTAAAPQMMAPPAQAHISPSHAKESSSGLV